MTARYETHPDGRMLFVGHDPNENCDHRTVGAHRAWCLDCSEWCYPDSPCPRCFRAAAEAAAEGGAGEAPSNRAG